MRRIWELIALLIIAGLMLKWFIEAIEPIAPYMVAAVLLIVIGTLVGRALWSRYRSW